MNKRNTVATVAMATIGLTVGALIVLPGPPALADATPPDYVTSRTFIVRWEVEREGANAFACRGKCRSAFADGGGGKGLWVPANGGYSRAPTFAGCVALLADFCDAAAVANAPTE